MYIIYAGRCCQQTKSVYVIKTRMRTCRSQTPLSHALNYSRSRQWRTICALISDACKLSSVCADAAYRRRASLIDALWCRIRVYCSATVICCRSLPSTWRLAFLIMVPTMSSLYARRFRPGAIFFLFRLFIFIFFVFFPTFFFCIRFALLQTRFSLTRVTTGRYDCLPMRPYIPIHKTLYCYGNN